MSQLILLRHGQSTWNRENRFTGWVDVDLSEQGIKEAHEAGKKLRGVPIDCVFTSELVRATHTAELAMGEAEQQKIPLIQSEALNERHYGDLQGLDKDEMRRKFGAELVHRWRRSYDIQPPGGESLKDTCHRVLPYFESQIVPRLKKNETVLVVAHGNSLRGLMKELEKISDTEIPLVEIPTGIPIAYDLDADLKVIKKRIL